MYAFTNKWTHKEMIKNMLCFRHLESRVHLFTYYDVIN